MAERSIDAILGFEALDSRGTPTVACVVTLAGGASACATVPSGASTGRHEAHELRDGGVRYGGRGTRGAVAAINGEIAARLRGSDAGDQAAIDAALRALDGTAELSRVGGNAILAVSIACGLAAAEAARLPLWRQLSHGPPLLPRPMVNVLSGGAHAGRAIDVQDVLVIPLAARTFAQAIEDAARVRAGTAAELRARGHSTALVADEGGLAAPLASNEEALEIATRGIERAGVDAALALDVAATQLAEGDGYRLACEGRSVTGAELAREIAGWAGRYPLSRSRIRSARTTGSPGVPSRSSSARHASCSATTSSRRRPSASRRAAAAGVANAVLVKPNQAGTLSDALAALQLAQRKGYATVVSARSGDTEDAWLADLAVGWRSGQIKVGSTQRSERTAKWNRLLRIEAECPDSELAPWRIGRPE